nr:hypothetical protein Q903MT_gene592 [Picea sitchensis]
MRLQELHSHSHYVLFLMYLVVPLTYLWSLVGHNKILFFILSY